MSSTLKIRLLNLRDGLLDLAMDVLRRLPMVAMIVSAMFILILMMAIPLMMID